MSSCKDYVLISVDDTLTDRSGFFVKGNQKLAHFNVALPISCIVAMVNIEGRSNSSKTLRKSFKTLGLLISYFRRFLSVRISFDSTYSVG